MPENAEKQALKVLMLGWEFPPILAGGLGQACYRLCKSLSHYVELKLVIPRSEEGSQLENVEILGLNSLADGSLPHDPGYTLYEEVSREVHYVTTEGLMPYPYSHHHHFVDTELVERYIPGHNVSEADVRHLYSDDEAYGPNIMEKVALYAEVVAKLARTMDFDIIHAHDWITYPAAIKIREESGKPLVVHIHSLETDRIGAHAKFQEHNQVYQIERNGMEAADWVIPVSHFTKQCATDHYGIDPQKMIPVHNAIDPIHPADAEKEIKEKIVLFLGRITHQKGPEYMVATAEKLVKKDHNIRFALAGKGDKLEEVRRVVKEKGMEEYFLFLGFLNKERVQKLLAVSNVYFMPSVSEPFGLSALEAAQYGIPCVLSRQSGVAEVLTSALRADYWDVNKFANYIYALLHYDALSSDTVERTTQDVASMSWDTPAQEVAEIYEMAMEESASVGEEQDAEKGQDRQGGTAPYS